MWFFYLLYFLASLQIGWPTSLPTSEKGAFVKSLLREKVSFWNKQYNVTEVHFPGWMRNSVHVVAQIWWSNNDSRVHFTDLILLLYMAIRKGEVEELCMKFNYLMLKVMQFFSFLQIKMPENHCKFLTSYKLLAENCFWWICGIKKFTFTTWSWRVSFLILNHCV